jgi:hypothetical protein
MHKLRQSWMTGPVGLACVALLAVGLGASCGGGATGSGTGATGTQTGGAGTGGDSGGTSTTSTTSSTTTTTTPTGPTVCASDADCASSTKGGLCDVASGECVKCLPTNDPCGDGLYCDPNTHTCATGCKANADCAGNPGGAVLCEPATHKCVNCVSDNDCPAGQLCDATGNVCIPGCSPTHDCPTGQTCCGSSCHDLQTDFKHCGDCNTECTNPINGQAQCAGGMCGLKACLPAFADCNGDLTDGCEWNQLQDGPCVCTPGATQPCYQGTPGTQNVGPCKGGVQTCNANGTGWGACVGQVLPASEICGNNIDEDCNGTADDVPDQDGDGWTICNGDCCDVAGQGCTNPKLVNPGAFEVVGDGVDNDCDPNTSDTVAPALCSAATKFSGVTATDVAKAMELCQTTTAAATGPAKKWGLIGASHHFANGAIPNTTELNSLQNNQTAITTLFGNSVTPRKGSTMAIISSGMARDANDPGWVVPILGTSFTSSITFPGGGPLATYVNAHGGGLLPGTCAGSTCPVGTGANDSVNIRLQIRTPTNAQGFSYDFRFYSAEYYTFQCTQFNDYYLASLTSLAPGIPADHNISFDSLGNAVSVNNGFFQDCGGNGKSCGTCPFGTASLAGTGFEQVNGGSTEWLTTDAPIVPGETITLELIVFDVGDHIYDTLMLLDNFRWSLTPVTLGTHT